MRITIQALIEGADGTEPRAKTIGLVERDADGAPALGVGLSLRETHAVLRQLQAVVLREHVGQRLEAETQVAVDAIVLGPRRSPQEPPPEGPRIELEIDAGYIRAVP